MKGARGGVSIWASGQSGLERVHQVGLFPGEIVAFGRAAEMAVGGGFLIDGLVEAEMGADALGRQPDELRNRGFDAAFLDRADAAENFDKLKDGSINVKGGWRLYSSGPGLYFGLVIRHFFGLRETRDSWIFDP